MFKKEKTIFCALTLYLNPTGNTSPKYESELVGQGRNL